MAFEHEDSSALRVADSFADNEPDWGDVDKTKLPRECFADPGEPDKKSTWRYPFKWVQAGGRSDQDGIYTSGTIRPHRGGINAAWAAANGAHTGRKDPELVKKLEAIRKQYGLPEGKAMRNAECGIPNMDNDNPPVTFCNPHPSSPADSPPPAGLSAGLSAVALAKAEASAKAEAAELRRAGAARSAAKDGSARPIQQKDGGQLDFGPAAQTAHVHTHEVHPQPPDWETVDESALPDAAFADPQKRLYAHHHVQGATEWDNQGRAADGRMYLHAAGAKCAFGKAIEDGASEQVIRHLAAHAFNLAQPDTNTNDAAIGTMGSGTAYEGGISGPGTHEPGAPQFGPAGKVMRNAARRAAKDGSALRIQYKDAVLAGSEAPPVAAGAGYIEGYAAIFGNVDSQGEVIRKGAFAKTIRERVPAGKVKLMTLHLSKGGSTMEVIGTVTQAREDDRGLWIHAVLSSDRTAQDARAKAAGGHVRGLSIGYVPLSKMEIVQDGEVVMELKEIKLLEVTLTPFPANELAEVTSAKSLDGNRSQPAIPRGAGPAAGDWQSAIARRKLALARLEAEE